ncbi:unnamed protein product, partial [Rotaria magnacalcarata]
MNNQKTSSNGGVSDIPSSPSSTQAKP